MPGRIGGNATTCLQALGYHLGGRVFHYYHLPFCSLFYHHHHHLSPGWEDHYCLFLPTAIPLPLFLPASGVRPCHLPPTGPATAGCTITPLGFLPGSCLSPTTGEWVPTACSFTTMGGFWTMPFNTTTTTACLQHHHRPSLPFWVLISLGYHAGTILGGVLAYRSCLPQVVTDCSGLYHGFYCLPRGTCHLRYHHRLPAFAVLNLVFYLVCATGSSCYRCVLLVWWVGLYRSAGFYKHYYLGAGTCLLLPPPAFCPQIGCSSAGKDRSAVLQHRLPFTFAGLPTERYRFYRYWVSYTAAATRYINVRVPAGSGFWRCWCRYYRCCLPRWDGIPAFVLPPPLLYRTITGCCSLRFAEDYRLPAAGAACFVSCCVCCWRFGRTRLPVSASSACNYLPYHLHIPAGRWHLKFLPYGFPAFVSPPPYHLHHLPPAFPGAVLYCSTCRPAVRRRVPGCWVPAFCRSCLPAKGGTCSASASAVSFGFTTAWCLVGQTPPLPPAAWDHPPLPSGRFRAGWMPLDGLLCHLGATVYLLFWFLLPASLTGV